MRLGRAQSLARLAAVNLRGLPYALRRTKVMLGASTMPEAEEILGDLVELTQGDDFERVSKRPQQSCGPAFC